MFVLFFYVSYIDTYLYKHYITTKHNIIELDTQIFYNSIYSSYILDAAKVSTRPRSDQGDEKNIHIIEWRNASSDVISKY